MTETGLQSSSLCPKKPLRGDITEKKSYPPTRVVEREEQDYNTNNVEKWIVKNGNRQTAKQI